MAKIVQFHQKGGPEVLRLEEVALQPVKSHDVRLRVHAIGLNRAESMFRMGAYLQDYTWPSRIGYEASGIVEAVGENVFGFTIGDSVSVIPGSISMAQHGTYGEIADVPASRLTHNPARLSHTDAAAVWMQYVTAYAGLIDIAGLKAGDTVLINAASSSVGIAAIQIARRIGAIPVAVTNSPDKAAALLNLGAAAVLNTAQNDFDRQAFDISNGAGAKVILDAVGGPAAAALQSAAATSAIHVIYGSLSEKNTEMSAMTLYAKRITVRGFQLFEATDDPVRRQAAIDFVLSGLQSGALKPVIAKTFPLQQIVESHRYLESNQQIGKIIVTA